MGPLPPMPSLIAMPMRSCNVTEPLAGAAAHREGSARSLDQSHVLSLLRYSHVGGLMNVTYPFQCAEADIFPTAQKENRHLTTARHRLLKLEVLITSLL